MSYAAFGADAPPPPVTSPPVTSTTTMPGGAIALLLVGVGAVIYGLYKWSES